MSKEIANTMRKPTALRGLVLSVAALAAVCALTAATAFAAIDVANLSVAPGSNENSLNFVWYSPNETASLQIKKQGAEGWQTIAASNTAAANGVANTYSHKATAGGLSKSTTYVYRITEATGETVERVVKTGNPDAFSFFLVGDPQIGSSNTTTDSAGWQNTMTKALAAFPNVNFMISAGDQVETQNNEPQYAGYLAPEELKSLPVAQTLGNHDNGTSGAYLSHYNLPNMSQLGATNGVGDNWYTYGAALFMDLNSNSTSIAAHKQFMEQAIAANPNAKWKVVIFHHSPYSEASHYNDSDQVGANGRRLTWTPVFDELGIDVVLAGHDHSYTRTYQMKGNVPQMEQTVDANGAVVNPTGTLYIEANSASGSKYYSFNNRPQAFFSAARNQLNVPEISKVDMTANSFTITTYRVDTMDATDAYTIVKREAESNLAVKADEKTVKKGDYFEVSVGFKEAVNSNAATLGVTFDGEKFQYANFTPAAGVTALDYSYGEGEASVTVMVGDYATKDYGKIMLRAKENAVLQNQENAVSVTVKYVVKAEDGTKSIAEAKGSTSVYTAGQELPDDVSLIDLSNIIDIFGFDSSNPDWTAKYRPFDYNNNGKIDIDDVVKVARMIKR
ncbi:MAG: metallophosphoesterase [Clostridiales Family XIII bacterium]|jgi:3',5'-cyclic AMP phosphodiesterase CpdA|nr:metallophosphoesterase [Clostridiales Family XIII bacterium]